MNNSLPDSAGEIEKALIPTLFPLEPNVLYSNWSVYSEIPSSGKFPSDNKTTKWSGTVIEAFARANTALQFASPKLTVAASTTSRISDLSWLWASNTTGSELAWMSVNSLLLGRSLIIFRSSSLAASNRDEATSDACMDAVASRIRIT